MDSREALRVTPPQKKPTIESFFRNSKNYFQNNIYFSLSEKFKRMKAFTLAEVLITLGIIGVVAALTMPVLIQNYKQKLIITRLKKFYSTMSQAVLRSSIDNGPSGDWIIAKGWQDGNTTKALQNFYDKYLAKYIINVQAGIDENTKEFKIKFSDGSYAIMDAGACIGFHYDYNGDKLPNEVGRDRYDFLLCTKQEPDMFTQNNIKTWYKAKTTKDRDMIQRLCAYQSFYCSRLLELDNWEFKKDYPYKI